MRNCLTKIGCVALLMMHGNAFAELVPCTSIPTVQISKFPTHNNEYGGHLNAHIYGQTPPAGYTQNGNTLFRNQNDWGDAYTQLETQKQPLMCDTNAPFNSEAARTLPLQFFSYRCRGADASGRCTITDSIQTHTVIYVFKVVEKDGIKKNGNWIVYTAYPSERQQ